MGKCIRTRAAAFMAVAAAMVLQGCGGAAYLEPGRITTGAIAKAERDKQPVLVGFLKTTAPDSKGAVGVKAQLYNSSGKPYRYVDLLVVGYNTGGRVVAPFAGDKELVRLRFKGPLKSRQRSDATRWAQVWYDKAVACVEIRRIDITYADGRRKRLGRRDAPRALPEIGRKSCRQA